MERFLDSVDRHIDGCGLTAEVWPALRPRPVAAPPAPSSIDLRAEGIGTILFATGYRPHHPWLRVPVTAPDGSIVQRRGVTPAPGMYVVGQRFQHRRDSGFIDGARHDARAVVGHLCGAGVRALGPGERHDLRLRRRHRRWPGGRRLDRLLLARAGAGWRSLSGRPTAATRCRRTPSCAPVSCSCPAGACCPRCSGPERRRSGGRCSTTPATPPVAGLDPPQPGVDALYAPRRHVLDRILVDAAAGRGRGRRPWRDGDRAPCATAAASPASWPRAAGAAASWAGAAASSSAPTGCAPSVARATGAAVERRAGVSGAVLYRYFADLPVAGLRDGPTATARRRGADPHQRRADLRLRGGEPRPVATASPAGRRRRTRGSARHGRARAGRPRARGHPVGRIHGWGGVPGFLRRSRGAGWALVGDAGYFKDPITTHGMTDAMRDAELLAGALLQAWSGAVPERRRPGPLPGAAGPAVQRPVRCHQHASPAYDWDQAAVAALLREVSSAMSDETELLQGLRAPRPAPQPTGTSADMLAGRQ